MKEKLPGLTSLFLLFCGVLWFGCKQSSDSVDNSTLVSPREIDPFVMNAAIGRGVNLGNALEAPNEGDWGVVLKEEYFQVIQEAGFNSVRIPIRWSAHADEKKPYSIQKSFFSRVDWAVNQGLNRGLIVVINIHHYEEIFADPTGQKERFLSLWQQIASHYRDFPAELLFEILNEPHGQLRSDLWNQLLQETLQVIRKSNPTRNVIFGAADWNSIAGLNQLQVPEKDHHLIATFHYYSPFHFTHQGAGWVAGSNAWLGTKWEATPDETRAVQTDLDMATTWGKDNNLPLYMGEFGAYQKADMRYRALWTNYVARQAESRGISWTYWEFCAGFGVYDKDKGEWRQTLLNALIPP